MTLKYLLDTNVVSEPLRPKPAAGVMRRLHDHEGEPVPELFLGRRPDAAIRRRGGRKLPPASGGGRT